MRDDEIKVVGLLELNANLSAREIAHKLGYKEHHVRKIIEGLTERDILGQKKAFVNLYALGLSDYTFFMQSSGSGSMSTSSAIDQFCRHPKVFWVASFIGEYQFAVAIFGKTPMEITLAVDELVSQSGISIRGKELSVRLHLTAFGRRYLSLRPGSELVYAFPKTKATCDDTDLIILQRLAVAGFNSIRSLSKELKIPLATLSRRIQRLEETNIIGGYRFWISPHHFGFREYRLLIAMGNNYKAVRKGLMTLCERIPHIVYLVNCMGAWECEIGCHVRSYKDLLRIVDEVYKVDPKSIVDVRVLEVIQHLKVV